MLATGCFDQAIGRVVCILVARLDTLIAKVNRLLGIVADVGYVAGGIVGVTEVLHSARWLWRIGIVAREGHTTRREDMRQAERLRIVFVLRAYSVPVLDQRSLPLGVVVDVGDKAGDGY